MPLVASARRSIDPFQLWLERCRAELGAHGLASDRRDTLLALASDMPRAYAGWQRECAQGLLSRLLCRLAAEAPRSDVCATAVVRLLGRDLDERWREEWAQLVRRAAPSEPAVSDSRVAQALAAIEDRAFERHFRLHDLARHLALSACRLTQLLRAETGSTFGAHLHRRRIAQACVLLGQPGLSVKEIAGRVGYDTTTQLDRQFKRYTSMRPTAYRRSLGGPRWAHLHAVASPAHAEPPQTHDTFADETTELTSDRPSRTARVP